MVESISGKDRLVLLGRSVVGYARQEINNQIPISYNGNKRGVLSWKPRHFEKQIESIDAQRATIILTELLPIEQLTLSAALLLKATPCTSELLGVPNWLAGWIEVLSSIESLTGIQLFLQLSREELGDEGFAQLQWILFCSVVYQIEGWIPSDQQVEARAEELLPLEYRSLVGKYTVYEGKESAEANNDSDEDLTTWREYVKLAQEQVRKELVVWLVAREVYLATK